jgi:hypothetical protein
VRVALWFRKRGILELGVCAGSEFVKDDRRICLTTAEGLFPFRDWIAKAAAESEACGALLLYMSLTEEDLLGRRGAGRFRRDGE